METAALNVTFVLGFVALVLEFLMRHVVPAIQSSIAEKN